MPLPTKQELIDAQRDAEDLEKVVNGAADLNGTGLVLTRTGSPKKTLAKLQAEYQAIIDAQEVQEETATASAALAEFWAEQAALNTALSAPVRELITDVVTGRENVAARLGFYGLDQSRRDDLALNSTELAFSEDYYREAYSEVATAGEVADFDYTRTGVGSALTVSRKLQTFSANALRLTDRGLLVEGEVQNKFLHSQAFDNAAWTKSLVTVTPNVASGPRGPGTMAKITMTGTGVHYIRQSVTGVRTSYWFAKAGSLGWCAIEASNGSGAIFAYFDLVNGVVGNVSAGVTARIEPAGFGCWLISISFSLRDCALSLYGATGNGGASFDASFGTWLGAFFYADMAQAEATAQPTSYIPTTSTAVTRGADLPALDFAPPGDFTLYVEVEIPASRAASDGLMALANADDSERVLLYRNASDVYALQVRTPGLDQNLTTIYDPNARIIRAAVTRSGNRIAASFAGSDVVSTTTSYPDGLEKLWIGRADQASGSECRGYVRTAMVYNRAFSDAELINITQEGERVSVNSAVQAMVDQALISHNNDTGGHDLDAIRAAAELADSKTGIWTVKAADTFTGADGVLTTLETGGQTWLSAPGNSLNRIGGVAKSPDSALRGNFFDSGISDGQLEAVVNPGSAEASLIIRYASNGNYLLIQRGAAGALALRRFIAGANTAVSPDRYIAYVAGERIKVRFIGPRIWVFHIANGVETLMFDVTETQWQTATIHGMRTNGTGSLDNFRLLAREAL